MQDSIFVPETFKTRPYAQRHFTAIVSWALENHPFYLTWLKEPATNIPLLTRRTVLDNNDALLNGHPITGKTSGTTGTPIRYSFSDEKKRMEKRASNLLVDKWLGGALTRSRIVRTSVNPGNDVLDISAGIDEQIAFIRDRFERSGAEAVITYPTNAVELCRGVIERKIDMSFIKRFGCYAEVFEKSHEDLIRQAFPNAQIWTTYSACELGLIAANCPFEPGHHHVFAEKLGIEILNDDGQPCQEGELGHVVVTDYFNTNIPFIRYDIGDMAAPNRCPCNRISFPSISNIAGKIRGVLKKSNGERVMYSELDAQLKDIPGIVQYQVIQDALQRFRLRYVAREETDLQVFRNSAVSLFQQQFGYGAKVEFEENSVIEREPNGKFHASICNC